VCVLIFVSFSGFLAFFSFLVCLKLRARAKHDKAESTNELAHQTASHARSMGEKKNENIFDI
jgi:hypothetical protein